MPSLKAGLVATGLYIAVVGIGSSLVYGAFLGAPVAPAMIPPFWPVQLALLVLCLVFVSRFPGWREAGFGRLDWPGLLWMLPAIVVLLVLLSDLIPALPSQHWSLLTGLLGISLLIGITEEVMFRGILLRAALTRLRTTHAMLLSAAAFAIMHAVIGYDGQPTLDGVQRIGFTFLVGFFLAPLALKIGSLWPLIIWHALWDFAVFASQTLGLLHPYMLVGIFFQVIVSLFLWAEYARAP